MDIKIKRKRRKRRHKRIRAKISGNRKIPRLCVFRSNRHIYAQLINDERGKTLLAVSDLELEKNRKIAKSSGKVAVAFEVGKLIGEKALKKKIKRVVFDRGGYKYHGRVKALAEGARESGLKF